VREPIKIHKLDHKGNLVWIYQGTVLSRTPDSITLEAYFDRAEIVFEDLLLRPGDRFVETFYSNRWYNVFAIYDVEDGQLKGWYCNICRPARIETGHVYAEDLALDLLVYPDRNWRVLDEDEFADLDLSQEEKTHAREALDQLIEATQWNRTPFIGNGYR
jgi:protein associated with RNAse G/E